MFRICHKAFLVTISLTSCEEVFYTYNTQAKKEEPMNSTKNSGEHQFPSLHITNEEKIPRATMDDNGILSQMNKGKERVCKATE